MDGYSIQEAAEVLGVPKRRIRELVARGVILGSQEDDGELRVFLQPRPPVSVQLPPEPEPGFEASPFRELLTEFRSLTERYGQALLALGESRGEVAALRGRVEALETRVDLRLGTSAAPSVVEWHAPPAFEAETLADLTTDATAADDAVAAEDDFGDAASSDTTAVDEVVVVEEAFVAVVRDDALDVRSDGDEDEPGAGDAAADFEAAASDLEAVQPELDELEVEAAVADAEPAAADVEVDQAPPASDESKPIRQRHVAFAAAGIAEALARAMDPSSGELPAPVDVAAGAEEASVEEDETVEAGDAADVGPPIDTSRYSAAVEEADWLAEGDFTWLDAADREPAQSAVEDSTNGWPVADAEMEAIEASLQGDAGSAEVAAAFAADAEQNLAEQPTEANEAEPASGERGEPEAEPEPDEHREAEAEAEPEPAENVTAEYPTASAENVPAESDTEADQESRADGELESEGQPQADAGESQPEPVDDESPLEAHADESQDSTRTEDDGERFDAQRGEADDGEAVETVDERPSERTPQEQSSYVDTPAWDSDWDFTSSPYAIEAATDRPPDVTTDVVDAVIEPAAAPAGQALVADEQAPAREASASPSPAAEETDEVALMWLGSEFDDRDEYAAEIEVGAAGWHRPPSGDELTRIAADQGWDANEVEAIRNLLEPAAAETGLEREGSVSQANQEALAGDRQEPMADTSPPSQDQQADAPSSEPAPTPGTDVPHWPPEDSSVTFSLPGGDELHQALAALGLPSRSAAGSAEAGQGENRTVGAQPRQWSKQPTSTVDQPARRTLAERRGDAAASRSPMQAASTGAASEASDPVEAASDRSSPTAEEEPSDQTSAGGEPEWLRGRRDPAARAYRRLRRIFPN